MSNNNTEKYLLRLLSSLEIMGLEKESEEVINILVKESKKNKEAKKDKCYYKVKSRYKKWPSAYASGALVKCREMGAENWGEGGSSKKKKTKKNKKKKSSASADNNKGLK